MCAYRSEIFARNFIAFIAFSSFFDNSIGFLGGISPRWNQSFIAFEGRGKVADEKVIFVMGGLFCYILTEGRLKVHFNHQFFL